MPQAKYKREAFDTNTVTEFVHFLQGCINHGLLVVAREPLFRAAVAILERSVGYNVLGNHICVWSTGRGRGDKVSVSGNVICCRKWSESRFSKVGYVR
jgi:hypothetical protein